MVSFTYDEVGHTTTLFLLSVTGCVLIPFTYLFWPKTHDEEDARLQELRTIHFRSKWFHQAVEKRRTRKWPYILRAILIILWCVFAYYGYQVSQIELVKHDWDPYMELDMENFKGVTDFKKVKKESKRNYKRLAILWHPDKCNTTEHTVEVCEDTFMNIKKANDILTDQARKQDWDDTGANGDNVMMTLGVALPIWLVSGENSWWVLGCYVLCFMIILPSVVGRWWYTKIKYNNDAILLNTTNMFQYFIYKSPTMQFKRLVQILSSAHEFHRAHNADIKERSSDNYHVPRLIQQLPVNDHNSRHQPMCLPYAQKARALIYSHLYQADIENVGLQADQDYVLAKCNMLINEMISTMSMFIQYYQMGRMKRAPHISTIDYTMKLSALLVQGIPDGKNPLFQLPYFTDRHLSFLQRKKIKSMKSLACLPESKRRDLLKSMSDPQYDELNQRLRLMPDVDLAVVCKVEDDEENGIITCGSLINVKVTMKRNILGSKMEQAENEGVEITFEDQLKTLVFGDTEEAVKLINPNAGVENSPAKSKRTKKGKKKKVVQKAIENQENKIEEIISESEDEASDNDEEKKLVEKVEKEQEVDSDDEAPTPEGDDEDDATWNYFQDKLSKRDKGVLEDTSRISHTVLTPKWPIEKQEHWWLYVSDVHQRVLFTPIQTVYNMTAEKEVTLQFQAPRQPGVYKYKLVIRSDSYLDCDRVQQLNVYVVPSTVLGERKNAEEEWGTISSEGSDNEHGDDRAGDSDSSYLSESDDE